MDNEAANALAKCKTLILLSISLRTRNWKLVRLIPA